MTASYGDRVRVKCGATGRYLDYGLALVVSAQDNDLFIDGVKEQQDPPPHPTLPVPNDDELRGAIVGLRHSRRIQMDALDLLRADERAKVRAELLAMAEKYRAEALSFDSVTHRAERARAHGQALGLRDAADRIAPEPAAEVQS